MNAADVVSKPSGRCTSIGACHQAAVGFGIPSAPGLRTRPAAPLYMADLGTIPTGGRRPIRHTLGEVHWGKR